MDRRKFISGILRSFMGGGLVAVSGLLIYRRNHADPEECTYNPACGSCDLFSGCDKPIKQIRLDHGKGNSK